MLRYNEMNQLTNDGTWAYTYDDNGNLIQKADGYNTFIYTYDYENRMIEVKWNGQTIQENFYDCCGKRIKMKNYNENGELTYTVIYIYIGWNTIYEKTIYPDLTVTETKYIYGASGHMAKITDTGTVETTTFYHTDVLGSVRQKTDSDGNSLWASYAIYKPFGGLYSGGPSDESETHLYTGKTYDYGTGLYYYGARFYDPEVGRFMSNDAVPSVNRYVYVLNNPLKYIDPNGLQTVWVSGGKFRVCKGGHCSAWQSLDNLTSDMLEGIANEFGTNAALAVWDVYLMTRHWSNVGDDAWEALDQALSNYMEGLGGEGAIFDAMRTIFEQAGFDPSFFGESGEMTFFGYEISLKKEGGMRGSTDDLKKIINLYIGGIMETAKNTGISSGKLFIATFFHETYRVVAELGNPTEISKLFSTNLALAFEVWFGVASYPEYPLLWYSFYGVYLISWPQPTLWVPF